jgi:spore coat protein U-like protein
MKGFLKVTAAAALLALAMAPGRALASGSGTATLPVQASVTSGCLIGTIGLNFGAVSPLIVEEDTDTFYTAAGAIEIACGTNGPTDGSAVAISLDDGANGAIAPILGIGITASAVRAMTNGTSFLAYDLFAPGFSSGIVGGFADGTLTGVSSSTEFVGLGLTSAEYSILLSSSPLGGNSPLVLLPVYGSIPGDQVQPLTPGIYVDTVNVSVTF